MLSLRVSRGLAVAAVLAVAPSARAERWLVVEAPVAAPVSDPQASTFRPGVMPALGLYSERGRVAFGARLRFGFLGNGSKPAAGVADPGMGGVATAGVAVRLAVGAGGWLEAVAGGGLTGSDLVPALELGFGRDFAVGNVDVGPSVHYLALVDRDAMSTLGSANLLLIGLSLRFGKPHPVRVVVEPEVILPPPPEPTLPRPVMALEPLPPEPPPPAAPAVERDPDRVTEREASCEREPKGCEIAAHIFLKNDRIVLEERVLFETGRAVIKDAGRAAIGQILEAWAKHPEWRHLTIEGHADARGTDGENLELSKQRAESVRAAFLELGADAAKVEAKGYGSSRPRDLDTSRRAYRHNRRVEFVIERARPAGAPR